MHDTSSAKPSPIALTCGDPAGVGPEIIARWLAAYPEWRDKVMPVGPRRWLDALGVGGVAVGDADFEATPGKPDARGQRVALDAMIAAADGCRDGRFRAVVTGPVSKAGLHSIGYRHPGQTEFFAERWGGEPVMAFAGERLRVVLATWHIPFAQVPSALDRPALARAVNAAERLARSLGATSPRIAVCGLNPHAGEQGLLGDEEEQWMKPLLRRLRRTIPGVSEPLPGDTVFVRALKGEFDATVAAYHDQGLAPLKAVDFDRSVNITLGLPHIRTSPDHGTAFGIAGKGVADGGSLASAIQMAERLATAQRRLGRPDERGSRGNTCPEMG